MPREAYGRIERLLAGGRPVLLDGGVASEVSGRLPEWSGARREATDTWAIYDDTAGVTDVHRRYAAAGCDVISTDTWGLLGATGSDRGRRPGRTGLPAWTVAARDAVVVAREGIAAAGRTGECAVAFCLNDADPLLAGEEMLLSLLWTADPPDLVLVETLPALPSPALQRSIAHVAASGMPVWVSFSFTAGIPDGLDDALAALARFGTRAFLVNCIPPDQVASHLGALLAATDQHVGCYPRAAGAISPEEFAEGSAAWRAAGAAIVGGCCGIGPAHLAATRGRLSPGVGPSGGGPGR